MALTNTQMQDEVRSNLGARTDLDTRLQRFLNLAQIRIARVYPEWDELEETITASFPKTATASNDKIVAISTSLNRIWSIRILDTTNSRKLRYFRPRVFDKHIPEPEYLSRGVPSIYTRWKGNIEIWRVPDKTYSDVKIRGTKWPTDLSTDAQTSDLDRKDDIIIMMATVIAWQSLGRQDRAAEFFKIYASMINEAVGENVEQPDEDIGPSFEGALEAARGNYWLDPFVSRSP